VVAQAGNFSFLLDGTVIANGLDVFSPLACEALG
jgi:hypothetical protein